MKTAAAGSVGRCSIFNQPYQTQSYETGFFFKQSDYDNSCCCTD